MRARRGGSWLAAALCAAVLCSAGAALAKKEGAGKDIDWDALDFSVDYADSTIMWVANYSEADGKWSAGELLPYGPLQLYPSAQVLNYGQSVFEGMKAQRTPKDHVVLFRPNRNAARMADGARRLSMEPPPEELFLDGVRKVVAANADWVPPQGKGSLYLRPVLMGSGPILGVGPAPSYTLVIYCAPVGSYFKGGQLTPTDLLVETGFHRAAPGGTGGVKAAGNYAPVLKAQLEAKKKGYSDVVFLDADSDTYLEEASAANIFIVKGDTIRTPPIQDTILPGITRQSIIELAQSRGYKVEEVPVTINQAMEADEMFTTGTAVVVSPVGTLTYRDEKRQFGTPGEPTPVAQELYDQLTGLQQERYPDPFGWVEVVA